MGGVSSKVVAPIGAADRARLMRDATDLRGVARRKSITLEAWQEREEALAAQLHFELGCWLFFYRSRVYKQDGLCDRVDCVRRIFDAGFKSPGYKFFTVFDFGERQFDTCFEMGDGGEVVNALLAMAEKDPGSRMAESVRAMGWKRREMAQGVLFVD